MAKRDCNTVKGFKGTEGEWSVVPQLENNSILILTEQRYCIALVVGPIGSMDIIEPNAKLIGAAPDLLKACNFALQGIIHDQVDDITKQILEDAINKALN